MATTQDQNADILVALAHPVRRTVLREMFAVDGPTSPVDLARSLQEGLANLSYHVRILQKRNAIVLTDTQPRRGAMKHFYEPGPAVKQPWVRTALGLPDATDSAEDDGVSAVGGESRS